MAERAWLRTTRSHDDPGLRSENLPAYIWAGSWNEFVVPSGAEQAALAALPVKREAIADAWPDGLHLATGGQTPPSFGGGGSTKSDDASLGAAGKDCWL